MYRVYLRLRECAGILMCSLYECACICVYVTEQRICVHVSSVRHQQWYYCNNLSSTAVFKHFGVEWTLCVGSSIFFSFLCSIYINHNIYAFVFVIELDGKARMFDSRKREIEKSKIYSDREKWQRRDGAREANRRKQWALKKNEKVENMKFD